MADYEGATAQVEEGSASEQEIAAKAAQMSNEEYDDFFVDFMREHAKSFDGVGGWGLIEQWEDHLILEARGGRTTLYADVMKVVKVMTAVYKERVKAEKEEKKTTKKPRTRLSREERAERKAKQQFEKATERAQKALAKHQEAEERRKQAEAEKAEKAARRAQEKSEKDARKESSDEVAASKEDAMASARRLFRSGAAVQDDEAASA